ncbi:MAG TPA: tRNA-dihydrouridine synthase, partial [Geothrix sp.]|nr:tRNA-dihydrouridine synthase [Geothrix sp.]
MTFPHSPFKIRDIEVPNRLVMAPLHEITDQPFRKFIREIGGVGLVVSEMISSEALIRHAVKAEKMMAATGERPLSMQISGGRPEALAEG